MMKRNRVSASASVLAVVVAMAGAALGLTGCAAATARPVEPTPGTRSVDVARSIDAAQSVDNARLTGYAAATVAGGASGPVSVVLHGTSVARLDQLVKGLPQYTGAGCMENIQLHQIDFTQMAGAERGFDVTGYQCVNLVDITSGGRTVALADGKCALLSAVRRLLPATAKATKTLTPPNCVKRS